MSENPSLVEALAKLHGESSPDELRAVYETHTTVTVAHLATATGRGTSWISQRLHQADTRMRPRGNHKKAPAEMPRNDSYSRPSSAVLRHILTRRLVQLRTQAGLTQGQVSSKAGISQATLIRAEKPEGMVTPQFLRTLISLYQVPPKEVDDLVRIRDDSRSPEWWKELGLRVPGNRQRELGLRADARRVYGWSDALVPDFIRTLDYATSVEVDLHASNSVTLAAPVLMAAQRRMRRRGIDQRYVVDEVVIRRRVGGARVMAEQLGVLRALAKRGRLRVLSWDSSGFYPNGPFELCSIPEVGTALHLPFARNTYLNDPPSPTPTLQAHRGLFTRLWEKAESPDLSVAMIDRALTQQSSANPTSP